MWYILGMGKAARQRKREAKDLVKVWGPRAWRYLWALLALAAAAWLADALHQHAEGLGSVQAAFAGLPALMAVLAVGLLPLMAAMPLVEVERQLKSQAAAATAAALAAAKEFGDAQDLLLVLASHAWLKIARIQARFLASAAPGLAINQTRVFLTPRILAQRPFSQPALTGCPV